MIATRVHLGLAGIPEPSASNFVLVSTRVDAVSVWRGRSWTDLGGGLGAAAPGKGTRCLNEMSSW